MNKKILFCASASSHILNFHMPYLRKLKESGFMAHTATDGVIEDGSVDKSFKLPYEKGLRFYKNIAAVYRLAKIIRREGYGVVSTHSTLAGLVGRLGVIFSFDKNVRTVHTCHGYLFSDDGSLKSKIMIIIEKILSLRTDALFVMNGEDYAIAVKYKLCKKIEYINGMGIDSAKLAARSETAAERINREHIPAGKKYFLCIGEFSRRKNQRSIIYAFADFLKASPDSEKRFHLVFLGGGKLLSKCEKLCVKLNIRRNASFCGHVEEAGGFCETAYCVVSASRSEGLPFNVMEALYYNTPVIASDVKGHRDLLADGFNGYLFGYNDSLRLAEIFRKVSDKDIYDSLKRNACLDAKYRFESVHGKVMDIYESVLEKG